MCCCVILDFMQAGVSAVTQHCRAEAPHAVRRSLDRRNQLGGRPLLSLLSNNHRGPLVCLRGPRSQDPPLGPVRSSHVLNYYLILFSVMLFELSSKTLWNPSNCAQVKKPKKKKRHGSLNGCFSRATVFILSTAPNAQCVIICPFSLPLIYVLHVFH